MNNLVNLDNNRVDLNKSIAEMMQKIMAYPVAYDGLTKKLTIKKVIFNGPATIIMWENGDKTVVKCHKDDAYDKRIGFMYACTKRICELGGFCTKSKTNKKPFDNWMDAWTERKAEVHEPFGKVISGFEVSIKPEK